MNMLCIISLGWLFVLFLCPICFFSQAITIRVINLKNGHPLEKQHVSISIGYDKGEETPAKYDKIIRLETDVDGKAQFSLPVPPPRSLSLRLRLNSEHWHYADVSSVRTEGVIQQGEIISTPKTKVRKSDVPIKARPGEIIFPARPFTFLERLFYPITKG
jgi:hypothetical protein